MKKFIINIIIFFSAITIIDVGFGLICGYMYSIVQAGSHQKRYYTAKETREDIVMLGSSRMHNHYIPDIIEEQLGMSCYNGGVRSHGIIATYAFLKMMLKRHQPKVIVYDVYSFDIYKDDNFKYITILKPFSDDKDVRNVITSVDSSAKWKLASNMYRYNLRFFGLLTDNFKPRFVKGFEGRPGILQVQTARKPQWKKPEVDPLKLKYLKLFIEECQAHHITLVFSGSPIYEDTAPWGQYPEVVALCEHYGVPFLQFYDDAELSTNTELFSDRAHLNPRGATIFTAKFAKALQETLSKQ